MVGMLTDLARSKSELVAENALLRQPLIILRRQVKRPACTQTDRMILVLLARASRAWKQALFIVQPETLLHWHRQGFRLYWRYTSRSAAPKPKVAAETVALIKDMAAQNRFWGAERIRGELLKLGIHVCLPHHSEVHEACSHTATRRAELVHLLAQSCQRNLGLRRVLQSLISSLARWQAFFSIELRSRRVTHVGVTRCPTDAWTARTSAGGHGIWRGAQIPHP